MLLLFHTPTHKPNLYFRPQSQELSVPRTKFWVLQYFPLWLLHLINLYIWFRRLSFTLLEEVLWLFWDLRCEVGSTETFLEAVYSYFKICRCICSFHCALPRSYRRKHMTDGLTMNPTDVLRKCKTYHGFVTSVYQFSQVSTSHLDISTGNTCEIGFLTWKVRPISLTLTSKFKMFPSCAHTTVRCPTRYQLVLSSVIYLDRSNVTPKLTMFWCKSEKWQQCYYCWFVLHMSTQVWHFFSLPRVKVLGILGGHNA